MEAARETKVRPVKEEPKESSLSFWRYVFIAVLGIAVGTSLSYLALVFKIEQTPRTLPRQELEIVETPLIEDTGSIEGLRTAVQHAITYLSSSAAPDNFYFGSTTVSKAVMLDSYLKLELLLQAETMEGINDYIQKNFLSFEVKNPDLLVTGYYEAELEGSRTQQGEYQYPLYRLPKDMLTLNLKHFKSSITSDQILRGRVNPEGYFLPYYSRQEIDYENAIDNTADVLVWLNDPIDAFFLHIQGSGIVKLTDGSLMRVNYAGKNGRAYRAIGRVLVQRGILKIEDVTMQAIQSYLRAHPEEIPDIFSYNESYVFFREVTDGPIGNLGYPVTSYRSIATDQSVYPKAALGFLSTKLPVHGANGEVVAWQDFTQLVINQDTGGAIKGGNRVDLFTGNGEQAELHAGALKESGRLVVFAPR